MPKYEKTRILIWGKTHPELSTSYVETVCTGGVLENGRPVRLYPIPYRYLEGDQKFGKYQWITADITKDHRDSRPESHRLDKDSIELGEKIKSTSDEWGLRAEYILKYPGWQFDSMENLSLAQANHGTSLGIVVPKEIIKITEKIRPDEDRIAFEKKFDDLRVENEALRAQERLFDDYPVPEFKKLAFVPKRLEVHWRCHGPNCNTHRCQALDWEVQELLRREGADSAKRKLEQLCNLDEYSLRFFMGNIKAHPMNFSIVGLWYPKKEATPRLF